jgi:hypothetical protein
LGQKSKDFLRQIIHYEYPNHDWEKDNFEAVKGYVPLAKKVLEELKSAE